MKKYFFIALFLGFLFFLGGPTDVNAGSKTGTWSGLCHEHGNTPKDCGIHPIPLPSGYEYYRVDANMKVATHRHGRAYVHSYICLGTKAEDAAGTIACKRFRCDSGGCGPEIDDDPNYYPKYNESISRTFTVAEMGSIAFLRGSGVEDAGGQTDITWTAYYCDTGTTWDGSTCKVLISTSPGPNGQIIPASKTIDAGTSTTFEIRPNNGHQIDTSSGCGGSRSGNIYTTGIVNTPCTVSATFTPAPKPNLVATNVNASNAVVGTPVTVSYEISNTTNVPINTSFQNFFQTRDSNNVVTDRTPSIITSLGANGKQNLTSSVTFNSPGTYSVRACADKANNLDAGVISESNENDNCSPSWTSVTISNLTYTVTSRAVGPVGSGTISPNGTQTVAAGARPKFTIAPASGFRFSVASTCPATTSPTEGTSLAEYTTGPISGNCKVDVTFTALAVMSGLLNPPLSSCTINENQNSCGKRLDWEVTNPRSGSRTTVTSSRPETTGSATAHPLHYGYKIFTVPYDTSGVTFFLRNTIETPGGPSTIELKQAKVTANCGEGLVWREGACKRPVCDYRIDYVYGINAVRPKIGDPTPAVYPNNFLIVNGKFGTAAELKDMRITLNGVLYDQGSLNFYKSVPQINMLLGPDTSQQTLIVGRGQNCQSEPFVFNLGSDITPSGDIAADATNCVIPAGGSTCNAKVTWHTYNRKAGRPTDVVRDNFPPGITSPVVSTEVNGTNRSVPVRYGTTTFKLFHDNIELDRASVAVTTCAPNSTWNEAQVKCVPNKIKVTSRVNGQGGSITPTERTVDQGSTTTFTVKPNKDYSFSVGSTCPLGSPTNGRQETLYTTGAITAPCEVIATFTPLPNLTASNVTPTSARVATPITFNSVIYNTGLQSTGASFSNFFQIRNSAGVVSNHPAAARMQALSVGGANAATFSFTFSSGGTYQVRACADKTSSTNAGVITESNEDDNCSASWADVVVSYTVTARAVGEGGSITPASKGVTANTPALFSITLSANKKFTISGSCPLGSPVNSTTPGSYATGLINSNCEVVATFSSTPCSAEQVLIGGVCIPVTVSLSAPLTYTVAPGANIPFTYTPTTNTTGTALETECQLLDHTGQEAAANALFPIPKGTYKPSVRTGTPPSNVNSISSYAANNAIGQYGYHIKCRNTKVPTATKKTGKIVVTTACPGGTTWNVAQSKCVPNGAVWGTITATATTGCPIKRNNSTCDVTINWSTYNINTADTTKVTTNRPTNTPPEPELFFTLTGGKRITPHNGIRTTPVTYSPVDNRTTFSLYHKGVLLDSETIELGCAAGTSWDNTVKKCLLTPSGAIAATSCKIKSGQSSCPATVTWTTQNLIPGKVTEVTRDNPAGTHISFAPSESTGVSSIVKYETTTFYLYHNYSVTNTQPLAHVSVHPTCESHTHWDVTKCVDDNDPGCVGAGCGGGGGPVPGKCGPADGKQFSSAPTTAPPTDLCTDSATAPTVSGPVSGPWTWTCTGKNGAASKTCSATKLTGVSCPAVPGKIKFISKSTGQVTNPPKAYYNVSDDRRYAFASPESSDYTNGSFISVPSTIASVSGTIGGVWTVTAKNRGVAKISGVGWTYKGGPICTLAETQFSSIAVIGDSEH